MHRWKNFEVTSMGNSQKYFWGLFSSQFQFPNMTRPLQSLFGTWNGINFTHSRHYAYAFALNIHWLKMSPFSLKSLYDWFALFDGWFSWVLCVWWKGEEGWRRTSQFHLSFSDNQWLSSESTIFENTWVSWMWPEIALFWEHQQSWGKPHHVQWKLSTLSPHLLYSIDIFTFFPVLYWTWMCYQTTRFKNLSCIIL